MTQPALLRFRPIADTDLWMFGETSDAETRWWWDTLRPLLDNQQGQPYRAIQTEADKDANVYRPIKDAIFGEYPT